MRTQEEVNTFVEDFETELFGAPKIQFTRDRKWSDNFTNSPGIYAIYDKGALIYIGESADVKERMKEVKRTINHSFRKKLGVRLFNGKIERGKFDSSIEAALDQYYLDNLSFSSLPLFYGRIEVEAILIKRNQATLLNSIDVRGNKRA